jgi:hypothetical protein
MSGGAIRAEIVEEGIAASKVTGHPCTCPEDL